MKRIVFLVIFTVVLLTNVFSQIENIKLNDEVTLDRVYVGSLASTEFSIDSLKANQSVNLRFGAMGTYQIQKWISLKSYAMYHIDKENPFFITQFWVKISPIEKLNFEIGNMATLVTEQRPHPVSGDGQFETWTESQIAPMAMNGKLKYQFTDSFKIGTGIAMRNNNPEYSAMLEYKSVKISSWYGQAKWNNEKYGEKLGVALTINSNRVFTTLVWKQKQVISDILSIKINKDGTLQIYADNGYDIANKKLTRGEWGFLKNFKSSYAKGLFGLGYKKETRSIAGYLFVHL